MLCVVPDVANDTSVDLGKKCVVVSVETNLV